MFWLVFERTSNPVILLDQNRRIATLNDAAVKLLGSERERLIGSSIADSIRADEQERSAAEWQAFLLSGEYSGTRALVRPDGSEEEVVFAARLADVDEGRAIYVVMTREQAERPLPAELALTVREREVVTLIALGRDTGDIAGELHISPETVRTHVRNSMAKLDVHTRAQLVAVVLCADQTLHRKHVEP
jgi:PAS domain S-box-containing protein